MYFLLTLSILISISSIQEVCHILEPFYEEDRI